MTLEQLIAAAKAKHEELKTLVTEGAEGWEEKHTKGMTEYNAMLKRIETLKALDNATPPEAPEEKPLKSLPTNAAQAANKPAEAGGKPEKGAPYLHQNMDQFLPLMTYKAIWTKDEKAIKDLGITSSPRGGWLIPPQVSDMIIQRLESALVFTQLGATYMPIDNQQLQIPVENSDITAYWVGEHQTRTATDFTGGSITMNLNYAAAMVNVSRLLLNSTAQAKVQELITRRITNRLRRLMEIAYLTGIGTVPVGANNTGAQPRGLINIPNVRTMGVGATLAGDSATASGALPNGGLPTLTDFSRLMQMVETSDVPETGTKAWVMHPRQKSVLREMADSDGRHYFIDNVANNREPAMLYGYPIYTTTQVPTNLTVGTSTDCSYVFFGEWSNFMIGNSPAVEMTASEHVNFAASQVVYKGEVGTDCNVEYAQAFAYMTGVRIVD